MEQFSMKVPNRVCLPTNHPYLNNKYTRWYYYIIYYAQTRSNQNLGYTERHHIIPESFFINRSRPGPVGWLPGNPNSIDNIVKLTAREHFICHWLLTKMVEGYASQKMELAMTYFIRSTKNQNRILSSGAYSRIKLAYSLKGCLPETRKKISKSNTGKKRSIEVRQAHSIAMTGKSSSVKGAFWWHNGQQTIRQVESPGPEWIRGQLKKQKQYKWWTDGLKNIQSMVQPGPTFIQGRAVENIWNNGIVCLRSKECPGPDWVPGGLKRGSWWNNKYSEKISPQCPGADWVPGRLPIPNKMLWWNNGVQNTRAPTCPGDDWVLGRLKR